MIEQTASILPTGCPPSVNITKTAMKGNTVLVTLKLGEGGTIKITGRGLKSTTRRRVKAGTHTITVPLTPAGRAAKKHMKKLKIQATLSVGAHTGTATHDPQGLSDVSQRHAAVNISFQRLEPAALHSAAARGDPACSFPRCSWVSASDRGAVAAVRSCGAPLHAKRTGVCSRVAAPRYGALEETRVRWSLSSEPTIPTIAGRSMTPSPPDATRSRSD